MNLSRWPPIAFASLCEQNILLQGTGSWVNGLYVTTGDNPESHSMHSKWDCKACNVAIILSPWVHAFLGYFCTTKHHSRFSCLAVHLVGKVFWVSFNTVCKTLCSVSCLCSMSEHVQQENFTWSCGHQHCSSGCWLLVAGLGNGLWSFPPSLPASLSPWTEISF